MTYAEDRTVYYQGRNPDRRSATVPLPVVGLGHNQSLSGASFRAITTG